VSSAMAATDLAQRERKKRESLGAQISEM
jgi:hypothetical protein